MTFFAFAAVARRDTVSTPFPKQLESKDRKRAYAAFVDSLEGVPAMLEVSEDWCVDALGKKRTL